MSVDLVGKRLDKTYEIVGKLGEGGMGVVYEARHSTTGRRVAIKVILSDFADDTLVARFQREARAAGSIDSRHIAQVLDAGTDPETNAPYLVMELLKGLDVDALMKKHGALRPTLALRIVAQALAGLERAHGAKVIHRDIKPANLYISEGEGGERIVKLVDFGVAKVKDDVTGSREYSLTQTASLLGSPLYMSPEQARTSKSVDGRADIWSLGIVLFQLLAGEAPHHLAGSLTELLLAICTEPAAPVQTRAPWVPPEIASIVAKSLEIDVAKRYPNSSAMLADIEAIVPDWQRLDESLITPMTDDERAVVARRVDPPPVLHTSTGPNGTKTISDAHIVAAGESAFSASGGGAKTAVYETSAPGVNAISAPGTAVTKAEPPAKKRSPLLGIGVGAGVLLVFVGGFIAARSGKTEPMPAPLVPATVTVTVSVSAPPPPPPLSIEPPPSSSAPPASSIPIAAPKPGPAAAPAPKPGPAAAPAPAPAPKPAGPAPKPNASSISREFN